MEKLKIGRAWEETVAFVKREPGSLLLISFGLIALPSLIFQAVSPDVRPGQTPEPGMWMLLFVPLIILSILGSLTITALALGASDAREAFSRALKRLPVMLGAVLLLALAAVLLALPFGILLSVAGQSTGAALVGLLFVLAVIYLWARLMLLSSVAAAENSGPASLLKRSWKLTSGHVLKLFGFMLVVIIVFLVVMLAVSAIFGSVIILTAGQPQNGNLSSVLIALVGGITNAALGLFLTSLVARIYAQLAGEPISGS